MPRIGIIGAGPAGLSLARLLGERGVGDVVLFERAARIGGKSASLAWQGLTHEVGTCYVCPNYGVVLRWMKECGITLYQLRRHTVERRDGSVESFADYVFGGSRLKTAWQVAAYTAAWLRFALAERTGIGRNGWKSQLAQSYGEWLLAHGFDSIYRFAIRSVTVMGYGQLDGIPTLNGLRWNTPGLIGAGARGKIFEPVEGWSTFWERLAQGMDIRLATVVKRALRDQRGFRLETNHGVERVDHLVITTPLDECSWVELPPDVRELARAITWHDYISTLVVAEGWFRDADTRLLEANLPHRGRLVAARRTADKVAGLPPDRPDVYVTYQYAHSSLTNAAAADRLREDIRAQGGKVTEVLDQQRWKYCPTLSSEAIAAGAMWKIEDIQGRDGLWFSGASFSHESVVNIAKFNQRLADHMVRRLKDEPRTGERESEERAQAAHA